MVKREREREMKKRIEGKEIHTDKHKGQNRKKKKKKPKRTGNSETAAAETAPVVVEYPKPLGQLSLDCSVVSEYQLNHFGIEISVKCALLSIKEKQLQSAIQ